ncbi:DUF1732 domain-containing protein [bacterium 3DAC]|nr:DUF1732 domain-containing protein [Dictyoglomota bacterium]UZN23150.1 DUF1732 domain-containing protein [bacterium 3DAC]
MKSMTGFAEATGQNDVYSVSVSVKGVNSRHLDINVRVPGFAYFVEYDIRSLVKDFVRRGKVDIYVSIRWTSDEALEIHWDTIHSYMKTIEEVLAMHPTLQGVISFDDVYHTSNFWDIADKEGLRDIVLSVARDALDKFVSVKKEEGAYIEQVLKEHLEYIEKGLAQIKGMLPKIYEELQKKVEEILSAYTLEGLTVKDIAQAISPLLVDEEIQRASMHIQRIKALFGKDDAVGYNLNILLQELQREINTMSQKIRHHAVGDIIVDMRSRVEAMKEHAMNVE